MPRRSVPAALTKPLCLQHSLNLCACSTNQTFVHAALTKPVPAALTKPVRLREEEAAALLKGNKQLSYEQQKRKGQVTSADVC